jgi:Tol biopolymer transport system component/DNA-binding winged helix-turn-helix (wHTH) protein
LNVQNPATIANVQTTEKKVLTNAGDFSDKFLTRMEKRQTKEFYDFGEFRLDIANRLLWRDGKSVALTLKEFEVLFFLVENAGQVIEKETLLNAVWKNTFIEDGTLTQNISRLRKKLEAASGSSEKFIETLPKRGYRFLPVVVKRENPIAAAALIVEEKTLTHIRVEETVSSPQAFAENALKSNLDDLLPGKVSKLQNPKLIWLAIVFGVFGLFAVAFAAYQNFFAAREAKSVLARHVAPFSGLPGRESFPAFSLDGKQLAFSWDGGVNEHLDVYVKLVGAGEPVRLTSGDGKSSLNPIFTPDGKRVAFSRSSPEKTEIFLVPALGGAERKIADVESGGTSFSFTPDGKTLAVADKDSVTSGNGIFFINVETGAKQRLTSPPENLYDNLPRVSPNGKSTAFIRNAGVDNCDLFIVSLEKPEPPCQLTFDGAKINGLAWSADGERIVFASNRGQTSSSNLWQIAASGGDAQLIAVGGKNPANPAISPDGKYVAFVEDYADANIWRFQIEDGGKQIPPRRLIVSTRADHSPQFSPDNQKIAFISDRTGAEAIWISDANGANQRQITDSGGSPRFSPDGKFILYDAKTNGNFDIFLISIEGGQSRRLTTESSQDILPAWSADGRSIYFCSDRSGSNQIWKMAASGGDATQVTRQGGFESFPAPDGKSIFYSKGDEIAGLWRTGVEGGEESRIAELSKAGLWRYWAIARNGIYFVAGTEKPPYWIKFYDFAESQIKDIARSDQAPILTFSGLSVSSDGKTILYAQYDQNTSGIMIAEF